MAMPAKVDGDHAVDEVGAAGAQVVSQIADDGLFAGVRLDLVR